MQGQMSIFDFLTVPGELDTIPEEEMVDNIGNALGVVFKYNDFFGDYRAKLPGKITLCIEYSNYCDGGARFIGADISTPNAGSGRPCDSISEAITFLQSGIRRRREEAERARKNATA